MIGKSHLGHVTSTALGRRTGRKGGLPDRKVSLFIHSVSLGILIARRRKKASRSPLRLLVETGNMKFLSCECYELTASDEL